MKQKQISLRCYYGNSLMSAIFFKEKLSAKAVIGIIMSFIGLLIMNVL